MSEGGDGVRGGLCYGLGRGIGGYRGSKFCYGLVAY